MVLWIAFCPFISYSAPDQPLQYTKNAALATVQLRTRPAQCGLLNQTRFGIVRGPHCHEGKLNIDTSVRPFNILDPLRGLDFERKQGMAGTHIQHSAAPMIHFLQDRIRNTNGAVSFTS